MAKVLIVDDEPMIVKGLKFSLEQDGYETESVGDGAEALKKIKKGNYDIVLLDLMLPSMSGEEVCKKVREKSMIPIIMLTAKGADEDKISGLDYGADDYMVKPFNIAELKMRMRNLLRRSAPADGSIIKKKDLVINKVKRTVFRGEDEIELTAKEFDIFLLLVTNPGKVFSRKDLLKIVWKGFSGDNRTVDVHIRRLRSKIEKDPHSEEYIFTKWGVGYYFAEN